MLERTSLSIDLYKTCQVEHQNFHIRVLKLWPGRIGEHIICDFDPYELGKHPPFTAFVLRMGRQECRQHCDGKSTSDSDNKKSLYCIAVSPAPESFHATLGGRHLH